MSAHKKSLGRGLGTLISGGASFLPPPVTPASKKAGEKTPEPAKISPVPAIAPASPYQEIPVGKIVPSRRQPRRNFLPETVRELADSIQSEGLIQPIVVRKTGEGYELIAGERRWRAFQLLNLKTIPARLINASDASTAVMTLIENLQREELNAIDEALGFASLMRDFKLTQETVAERVGKPRATIANSVRLLSLNREIQGYVAKNMLTAGHAKVLLGLAGEAEQLLVARRVVEQGASVRETEKIVQRLKSATPAGNEKPGAADSRKAAETTAVIAGIEKKLTSRLNTKVQVKHGAKLGKIVIEYYGNDDLRRILEKLGADK